MEALRIVLRHFFRNDRDERIFAQVRRWDKVFGIQGSTKECPGIWNEMPRQPKGQHMQGWQTVCWCSSCRKMQISSRAV